MKKLSDDEIRATPLPEGFTLSCFNRDEVTSAILLHVVCPNGHQIIKNRTVAGTGCDICRRNEIRKGTLPEDWRFAITDLPPKCGLAKVAKAIGIPLSTLQGHLPRNDELREALKLFHGEPRRGGTPGVAPFTGPQRKTLQYAVTVAEERIAALRIENDELRAQLRDAKPLPVSSSAIEVRLRQLMTENRRLRTIVSVLRDLLPNSVTNRDIERAIAETQNQPHDTRGESPLAYANI